MESDFVSAKVVILGAQGVGKTSVVVRYVGRLYNRLLSPTIGASFFTCKLMVENCLVRLQIWDTAGQERFRAMAPMYYRNANAALLVFDISSYDSFRAMKEWVLEIQRNVEETMVMCVLGNKCDLDDIRRVACEEARQYAASINALYFETSALNATGIEDAFQQTAAAVMQILKERRNSEVTETEMPVFVESERSFDQSLSLNMQSSRVDSKETEEQSYLCC